jgi:hypothetical protein
MGQMSQDEINVDLFDEVKRQKEEIQSLKMALWSCKNNAERIISRDYGETMDAHEIVDKVNDALGEDY